MSKITIDSSWEGHPKVIEHLKELGDILSPAQKRLLTPVFINSTTLEILNDAYTRLFKASGVLYTPLAFRYSYSARVLNKNVMITSKYHLEKDFNLMKTRYHIVPHLETLLASGAKWEQVTYDKLLWFKGTAEQAVDKLISCRGKDGWYYGWYYKEVYPDNPVK